VHLCLEGASIYNVLVAGDGSRERWVKGNTWNAGDAASHCKTAMNRNKGHRINHENSQNQ